MSTYKEIVTKAVIGKGKKTIKSNHTVVPEETPNTVLGCWVINHRFSGVNNNGDVNVSGSFDVNIWYSYDNDTKTSVTTRKLSYTDTMKLRLLDNTNLNQEIIIRSLKQPTVTDVSINNNEVKIDIEKELGIEIVGETKVKIAIEDDIEEWDDIIEEDKELEQLNEDYLK